MKNRRERKSQGDALQRRIKMGQQKSKGYLSNIFPSDTSIPLWQPKEGDHIIDIIPYTAGKHDPFTDEGEETYTFEYEMHRVGPNNSEYICPGMYDKACPICEYRNMLRDKNDDKYKSYWPKRRNLYNVIVYDDEKETKKGVQVWDISYHYFEKKLMAISRKPSRAGKKERTINFVSPSKGRSITFTIEPPKSKDDYRKYEGHAFDDRDYQIGESILDDAYCLDSIVHFATYDEIKEAFDGGKHRSSRNPDDGDENESRANSPKEMSEDKIASIIEDIRDAKDINDILDAIDDNNLDNIISIDEDGRLERERKKAIDALEELLVTNGDESRDYDENADEDKDYFNPELVRDELNETKELSDIRKFCKKYDIKYKLNRDKSVRYNQRQVLKLVEEKANTSNYKSRVKTKADIAALVWDDLWEFINDNQIPLDENDYDEDEIDEVVDEVCIELDITD